MSPLILNSLSCNYCRDINTLRPRQKGRHFADDIFKCIFLNENVWIPIKISMKFVLKGPINNISAMVHIMAWRRPGDKPLSEPMMVSLTTHICVTLPQWVNGKIFTQLFKTVTKIIAQEVLFVPILLVLLVRVKRARFWKPHSITTSDLYVTFAAEKLWSPLNILRPRQNGRNFPDDIFKGIFLNENVWISLKISLN